jgi:NADH-ubiquinone oxidoreductase chain 5
MVTAGVFLLIKCSPVFEYSPNSLLLITFIGLLTAIFAASSGLVQNDIKKVIAYSTCSQLGYMIFSCGLSQFDVSLFHLSNHAVFKALLFLSAGSVIHGSQNEQDMRKFGSRGFVLPFTIQSLFIGSLALVGFPFLTGYYSKDLIIELSFSHYTVSSSVCYIVAMITTFLTSMYSYRVLYLTTVFKTNSYKNSVASSHEAPIFMSLPLFTLSVGSFFSGYIFKDLFVGLGTQF